MEVGLTREQGRLTWSTVRARRETAVGRSEELEAHLVKRNSLKTVVSKTVHEVELE